MKVSVPVLQINSCGWMFWISWTNEERWSETRHQNFQPASRHYPIYKISWTGNLFIYKTHKCLAITLHIICSRL